MKVDVMQHIRVFGQIFHRKTRHMIDKTEHNTKHSSLCAYQLSMMQKHVLHYIIEKTKVGEVYQKDIEKAFCIRRSTASHLLKQLEDKQLINRKQSEVDRRLKRIVVDDKVKQEFSEIYTEVAKKMQDMSNIMTKGLSEQDLEQFVRTLDHMRKNLEEDLVSK